MSTVWIRISLLFVCVADALKILQIVPGFTNSHVLFNYRLAETLKFLGHDVHMWTQMEMAMLDTGNNRLPAGVTEYRIAIEFKDKLKIKGLKSISDDCEAVSAGFTQSFTDRIFNLLWHLSLLDFVNLPQNLLHDENEYYQRTVGQDEPDLWDLSQNVPALLINGERMLDFPRPLPIHISFSGELGLKKC
ncbi:hypothetical protein GCK32_012514, partial [Trichostrongylus colubriformis]